MKWPAFNRILLAVWLIAVAGGALLLFDPAPTRLSRGAGLGAAAMVWIVGGAIVWRWRAVRYTWLTITSVVAIFLLLPVGGEIDPERFRERNIAAMKSFEGSPYFWGGESRSGVDCSGLIRRGAIDALFREGVTSLNPHLVRESIGLWWNDTSARQFTEGYAGRMTPLFESQTLEEAQSRGLKPGDVAVTADGVHTLAYIGGSQWIEADPGLKRVTILDVPSFKNPWAQVRVNLMRWKWAK